MWKTIGKATIALLFLGFLYVPIAAHAAEDVTPPQVTAFNISPTQIDTSELDQQITITMTVTDDLSGNCYYNINNTDCTMIGSMQVNLTPLIGTQSKEAIWHFNLISGDAMNGTYQEVVTIPRWSKSGVWQVSAVHLVDKLGNRRDIYTSELSAMFPDSNLIFTNTQVDKSVKIEKEWKFASASGDTTVTFPENTVVTRKDGGNFQFYKMVNQTYTASTLPVADDVLGLPIAALRFGLPGLNISFSQPVSVSMHVPADYAGQTLAIQSLQEGQNEWANETSCTVSYVGDRIELMIPDPTTGKEVVASDQNGTIYVRDPKDTDAYGVCVFSVSHASYFSANTKPYIVTGEKAGGSPAVRIYTSAGKLVDGFLAYSKTFKGGINVAVGDVNGDGVNEIITSPRQGGAPSIRVFKVDGTSLKYDFSAYDTKFKGGVNIAVGDVNKDGKAEIVTAPISKGGPDVRVYKLVNGKFVSAAKSFNAYDKNFRGGVFVSIGDVNNDGTMEIVTTPVSNAVPKLKVFIPKNGGYVASNLISTVYDAKFLGGLNSFVGDINHNGKAEIITSPNAGTTPLIKSVGMGNNGKLKILNSGFLAYAKKSTGGVSLTICDINNDGYDEIITVVGGNGVATVRAFNQSGKQIGQDFNAFPSSFKGGATIASGYF
jgi:hypothetical protein